MLQFCQSPNEGSPLFIPLVESLNPPNVHKLSSILSSFSLFSPSFLFSPIPPSPPSIVSSLHLSSLLSPSHPSLLSSPPSLTFSFPFLPPLFSLSFRKQMTKAQVFGSMNQMFCDIT